ncbi:MAG: aminotransferase class III-fold pyridoxal phosphate-dependent enzyme [Sedimentisphaerales bacterium]
MNTARSQQLYSKAKTLIPGGTQLLSKRPEMFAPDIWPAYFSKAKGCEIWDLDGNHYYDMSTNGIGACLLGFADPDVSEAVTKRIKDGSMCTLNPPEEVELAEKLCEIHPWAQQVRFARSGGEIAAIAIRIARATTNRSKVAFCGYHGWHDWYLAANLSQDNALEGHLLPGLNPNGVPRQLCETAFPFKYNDISQLNDIIKKHGDDLAAVIMEPTRYDDPKDDFLNEVKKLAKKSGALLIFDEITIGWRLCFGGAHLKYQIDPDMAIFAKALGNGHPVAAVVGTTQAMQGAHFSFISSTYWTESVGTVAALATLNKMANLDVPGHIAKIGRQVVDLWQKLSQKYGLKIITGKTHPCLAQFKFEHICVAELKTLYTQLMLKRGFLAGTTFYPTMAHNNKIIELYGVAIDEVFCEISKIVNSDDIVQHLEGPVAHSGFARLN